MTMTPEQWREMLPMLGIAMHALGAIILISYLWPWLRHRLGKASLPGPAFLLPVVGETLQLFQSPTKYMWNRWLRYGSLFRTNLLGYQLYVVGNPAVLRSVWSNEEAFGFFVPGKTFSLLITDVRHMQDHHQHTFFRRKLGQALSPAAVAANLVGPMAAVMTRRLDQWERQGRVQLQHECAELSMDVALEAVTGLPLPPAAADKALVRSLFRTVLEGLYGLPVVLPGTKIHRALRARRRLMALLWPGVKAEVADLEVRLEAQVGVEARAAAAEGAGGGTDSGEEAGGAASLEQRAAGAAVPEAAPMRMLEAQIASAVPFRRELALSSEQIFERALGTVVAVDETSRHLFFAAVAATALAHDVRARLLEEQREAMRKHGDDLSYSVLADLPYLDAVVKETLRLFPPSIGGFRTAKRDVQVEGGVIPRGSVVFWSTHLLHASDPAMLPRTLAPEPNGSWFRSTGVQQGEALQGRPPGLETAEGRRMLARAIAGPTGLPTHMDFQMRFDEAFRPERWLSTETRPRQFVVFGGGLFLCLGQHVALIEVKLLLSLLLRRFDFRLEDPALLAKCSSFPAVAPKKGTDGLILVPRPLEP